MLDCDDIGPSTCRRQRRRGRERVSGLRFSVSSGFLFAFASVFFCSTGAPGVGQTLVSVEEEIEIGRSANEQVRMQVPELRDATVTGYVRDVGKRLVRAAPGAKYPYTFAVADLPEINAFSLPGGPVWINRGVLSKARNESQVAAVLAHEIAHIAQRHGADRLTQGMVAKWGLGLLGALLGNSGGAGTAQAAASLLAGGVFLKFNRNEEREADKVGMCDPDTIRVERTRDGRAVRDARTRGGPGSAERRGVPFESSVTAGPDRQSLRSVVAASRRDARQRALSIGQSSPRARRPVAPEVIIARVPNRLASEQSPYLLQHKDNPVDWYPWGQDAFDGRARRTSRSSCRSATRRATGAT